MKRRLKWLPAIGLAMACATACQAQDWAKAALAKSPRHGEFVTIQEPGGRSLEAWVVYPEVKERAPVVVMIHEIFGLSDWAREMADELAGAGYIVVEPDLLSGFGPAPPAASRLESPPPSAPSVPSTPAEMAMPGMGCDPMACPPAQRPLLQRVSVVTAPQMPPAHNQMQHPAAGSAYVSATPGGTAAFPADQVTRAVSALPDAQVLADLDAAAEYGKKLPAANGKLFVVGFCWGGGKSFLFATHRHDLSAAFVFYGGPPAASAMASITAPVYGFYAGNDARISATLPQTEADTKAAGKVFEPVVYDGAGHGFMRAGEAPDATAANTAARQEGFRRLVKLLGGVR